jgi:hypothetical protein
LEAGDTDFHNSGALPDGRGVLFVIHRTTGMDTIALWSPGARRKVLLQIPDAMIWRPVYSRTGHVLFQRGDESRGIWAFPFSLEKLDRTAEPFRVSDLGVEPSVADDGTLAFSLSTSDMFARRQLTWVDRAGKILSTIGPPLPGLAAPALSPDQRQVVAMSGESMANMDLRLFDKDSGGTIPFTKTPGAETLPHWWNNGRTVVFLYNHESSVKILAKPLDGAAPEEVLFEGSGEMSSSGKYLFVRQKAASGKSTHKYISMTERERKLVEFPEPFQKDIRSLELSPDDHWLTYCSDEFGQFEVYLVAFPGFTNKVAVSRNGGHHPRWNPNGSELFYLNLTGRALMSAKLNADGPRTEEPVKVFDLPEKINGGFPWWPRFYDVAKDGQRFLMLQNAQEESAADHATKPNLRIVLNWFEEFREKK